MRKLRDRWGRYRDATCMNDDAYNNDDQDTQDYICSVKMYHETCYGKMKRGRKSDVEKNERKERESRRKRDRKEGRREIGVKKKGK